MDVFSAGVCRCLSDVHVPLQKNQSFKNGFATWKTLSCLHRKKNLKKETVHLTVYVTYQKLTRGFPYCAICRWSLSRNRLLPN